MLSVENDLNQNTYIYIYIHMLAHTCCLHIYIYCTCTSSMISPPFLNIYIYIYIYILYCTTKSDLFRHCDRNLRERFARRTCASIILLMNCLARVLCASHSREHLFWPEDKLRNVKLREEFAQDVCARVFMFMCVYMYIHVHAGICGYVRTSVRTKELCTAEVRNFQISGPSVIW